jgi:C4-dicarboxylate transporter DctM subunit
VLGVLPFVALMTVAVFVLCLAPPIATWVPDLLLGDRIR